MFAMTLAGHHRHHHHHQTYGTKNVICKSPHKTPCGHIAKQKMKTCDRKKTLLLGIGPFVVAIVVVIVII